MSIMLFMSSNQISKDHVHKLRNNQTDLQWCLKDWIYSTQMAWLTKLNFRNRSIT
jgi:hypothetical protein